MKEDTIDIAPTWEFAVRVYIDVLQNESASFESIKTAKEELIKLAKYADHMIAEKKNSDKIIT